VYHVLHRHLTPRHSPCALCSFSCLLRSPRLSPCRLPAPTERVLPTGSHSHWNRSGARSNREPFVTFVFASPECLHSRYASTFLPILLLTCATRWENRSLWSLLSLFVRSSACRWPLPPRALVCLSAPEANRRRCRYRYRLSAPTLLIPPANKKARQGPGQELSSRAFPAALAMSSSPAFCPVFLYLVPCNLSLVSPPMEMRGLEPLASAVQRRRSPS
jgi:hypothetical protein